MNQIKPSRPNLPETGFVRRSLLLQLVPLSNTTLWRRIKDGSFPAPVKISERAVAWRAEEVRQWINDRGLRA